MDYKLLADIVERAKNGDKGALEELYNETHNRVYFYAYSMFRNEQDASDIVQEVFVKVFVNITNLKEAIAFPSWLYKITVNECNQRVRKDKKAILMAEGEEFFNSIIDQDPSLEITGERKELRNYLLAVIEHLPEDQKRTILLYYYEQLTIAQIAEIEGCVESTIKSRLKLAREKIKRAVEVEEKKCGVKLYSFGAPAMAAVLAQTAMTCIMPANLARQALMTALSAVGFIDATDSFTVITPNEETTKSFKQKLKQGIIVEIKPYKIVLSLAIVIALTAGAIIWAVARPVTLPIEEYQEQCTVKLADLPEEIQEKAAYVSFVFYECNPGEVTPEMAYMRCNGGYTHFFDEFGALNQIEDVMTGSWFYNNMNVVAFFDVNGDLLCYAYEFAGEMDKKKTMKLELITKCNINKEKLFSQLDDTIASLEKDAIILSNDIFYYQPLPNEDSYSLAMDYTNTGINEDDVYYFLKLHSNTMNKNINKAIIHSELAQLWTGNGNEFLPLNVYDKRGLKFDRKDNGIYNCDSETEVSQTIALIDKDFKILGYAFLSNDDIYYK